MNLNRLVFRGIFSLALIFWAGSAMAATGFTQVIWTCKIPCETAEAKPETLRMIQIGWCGKTVMSQSFFDSLSSRCRSENQNPKAHAVRRGYYGAAVAHCETSGNVCPEEGLANVNFSCHAVCPGEETIMKYSVCAASGREAWGAANLLCPGAEVPHAMPVGKNCEPNGQTPCTPN